MIYIPWSNPAKGKVAKDAAQKTFRERVFQHIYGNGFDLHTQIFYLRRFQFLLCQALKNQIGHQTGHESRRQVLGQKTTPETGPQNMFVSPNVSEQPGRQT